MSEWNDYLLEDVVEKFIDYRGKTPTKTTFGVPLITAKVVKGGRILEPNEFISEEDYPLWMTRGFPEINDVVLTSEAPLGEVGLITSKRVALAQRIITLQTKKQICNSVFLKYYLQSQDGQQLLQSRATGTTVEGIKSSELKKLEISLPPLQEQEAIAEVLSSLDDKIDLLHRSNKTLGELAKALFQETITNKVEQKGKLKDYVLTANTGLDAIKRAPIVEADTGLKCLRIQDVSQVKSFKRWGNTKVEPHNFIKFQLRKYDIIMARTCSPGINYLVRVDLPAVFNNGLVRIRANNEKVHPLLLYYLFKTKDFIGHVDGISGGTSVQLNMQIGDLLDYDVSFPSKEIQENIVEAITTFDDRIHANHKQIDNLENLRNTLLPKLMSGAVRVNTSKLD